MRLPQSVRTTLKSVVLFSICFCSSLLVSAQPYNIGHTSKIMVDTSRENREILTEIYYPADQAGENVPVLAGCFPTITFGHGFVMSSVAYQNIWEAVVSEGYIMVFVDSEVGLAFDHETYGLDLAFVVDQILILNSDASDLLGNNICGKNVVIGHSTGGGSAVLAINNTNNIDGYVGLAPSETSPSAIAGAANVTIPSLILSGTSDGVTPPIDHHIPIYDGLSSGCKTIVNLTGGAHCYFADEYLFCDFGEESASTGITLTRAEQQLIMYDHLIPWLAYLNTTDDFGPIRAGLMNDGRVTFESNCGITDVVSTIETELSVSPNPTFDVVSIADIPNNLLGEKYIVTDVYGRRVLDGQILSNNFTLNTGPLSSGVYLLIVEGMNRGVRILKL